MVFSSITFLCYFLPAVLLIYHLLQPRYRNFFLLLSSILFYSWGGPRFIFVILGTTALDFLLVKQMDRTEKRSLRKMYLVISLCINLGLLFYFKYFNFFIENLNALGLGSFTLLKIVMPIGISFYTFESITYMVDVYRRTHKSLDNFWDYQLYILLFPKLIAGPIVRYHEIADQVTDRRSQENADFFLMGFIRFVIGLSKKILIANVLAGWADHYLQLPAESADSSTAWIGMLCYTFQIYFDFSGYSDMALGIGKMLGFKFPENFNHPYISAGITEFWRRWHMSLGRWMKNYLYIPLGGNQEGKIKTYRNLWLVFLASGLWHGASYNFLIWGAFHGSWIVIEKTKWGKIFTGSKWISIPFTFFLVVTGWVFFYYDTLPQAWSALEKMFSFRFRFPEQGYEPELIVTLLLAFVFSFIGLTGLGRKASVLFFESDRMSLSRYAIILLLVIFPLFVCCLSFLLSHSFNPFIYFRF